MLDFSHLPRLDPRVLETANEICTYAFDLQARDAKPFDEVKISCPGSIASGAPHDLVTCQIRAEFGVMNLTVQRQLIDLICDRVLPGWRAEDPEKLILSWRTVICVEEILGILGEDDIEYSVLGVQVPEEQPDCLNSTTIDIEIDGHLSTMTVVMGPIDGERVSKSFGQSRKKTLQTSAIDVPVQGQLVGRTLTNHELDQLSVGDALLLCQGQDGNLICKVDIASTHSLAARCTPDGNLTILGKDIEHDE